MGGEKLIKSYIFPKIILFLKTKLSTGLRNIYYYEILKLFSYYYFSTHAQSLYISACYNLQYLVLLNLLNDSD